VINRRRFIIQAATAAAFLSLREAQAGFATSAGPTAVLSGAENIAPTFGPLLRDPNGILNPYKVLPPQIH